MIQGLIEQLQKDADKKIINSSFNFGDKESLDVEESHNLYSKLFYIQQENRILNDKILENIRY